MIEKIIARDLWNGQVAIPDSDLEDAKKAGGIILKITKGDHKGETMTMTAYEIVMRPHWKPNSTFNSNKARGYGITNYKWTPDRQKKKFVKKKRKKRPKLWPGQLENRL